MRNLFQLKSIVSKQEAREKIEMLIAKGQRLRNQSIDSQEQLDTVLVHQRNWSISNKDALLDIFENSSVASEYISFCKDAPMTSTASTGYAIDASDEFLRRVNIFREGMDEHIDRLTKIRNGLGIFEQPSNTVQHTVGIKDASDNSSRHISNKKNSANQTVNSPVEVFIVHGRDELAKADVALLIRDLGFKEIILEKKPNSGLTIIEKFEQHARSADFAIALLTPDDVGALREEADSELKSRARQNVILELGYFLGRLGRRKVCLLIKGELENPSDLDGLLYVPMGNSDDWRMKIAREMKQAGLPVDMNKLA